MKIFLSWSGERSKLLASSLRDWLPMFLNFTEPWMSDRIDKGTRWSDEVAEQLEKSSIGIICLTPENLESPWIHFEAGALTKHKEGRAITLLLDLEYKNILQPLAGFQHTLATKEEMLKLVEDIVNIGRETGEQAPTDPVWRKAFEKLWPQFEEEIENAKNYSTSEPTHKARTSEDLLSEILEISRQQAKQIDEISNEVDIWSNATVDVSKRVFDLRVDLRNNGLLPKIQKQSSRYTATASVTTPPNDKRKSLIISKSDPESSPESAYPDDFDDSDPFADE